MDFETGEKLKLAVIKLCCASCAKVFPNNIKSLSHWMNSKQQIKILVSKQLPI